MLRSRGGRLLQQVPHGCDPLARPRLSRPRPRQRGYNVRALSRSADKVQQLFGGAPGLSVAIADMRDPASLPAALRGVDAVCCCTGTTAFPSKRCAPPTVVLPAPTGRACQ